MTLAFDPHYHTQQSDGEDAILPSVQAAYRAGLAALIITDHLTANPKWPGPTHSYQHNIDLIKILRTGNNNNLHPIIVGIELLLPPRIGDGEVLIFGTELCAAIQENLSEVSRYDFEEFRKLKENFGDSAIVQCHPTEGLQERLVPVLDGCELTKIGIALPNIHEIEEACKKHGITPLVSSDGHTYKRDPLKPYLGKAYNLAAMHIQNEKDLITAIKENHIERRIFHKERCGYYEHWANQY